MPASIPPDAYVMIIGAMKAGTSSLFRLLEQHPAICAARAKEPEFFSEHQGHEVPVERYEDLFDFDLRTHRVCLEASTGYTKYPEETGVPHRMQAYGLRPRFIYIVRDPVERVSSHLNYADMNSYEWAASSLFGFYAVTFSMYHTQLRKYLACYPDRDRYFIADFDDLRKDPAGLVRDIFRWLDLDTAPIAVDARANATPPRSKAELALSRSPIHRIRHLLPTDLREQLKTILRSYGTPAKQDLTEVEKSQLHAWLEPDVIEFGRTFGFPVEKWGFAPPSP